MLIHNCARRVRGHAAPDFFDKNGEIWCILSVPKLVIINLKIIIFFDNQQPKFCAIFFSKINSDAYFGTKINTFTFYKGCLGGGAIAPRSQRNLKKWRLYVFYTKYFIPNAKIYPVTVLIQIYARDPGLILLSKWCNLAHPEFPEMRYYHQP